VDLDLSDDQQLFLETTRRFLTASWPTSAVRRLIDDETRFDRDLWIQGAELGWTAMLVPEELGGGSISGEGVCDLGIVAEELGRFLVPGPVIPSNVVAYALARHPSEPTAREHLPALADGREIAAWAVAEANDCWMADSETFRVEEIADGYRLTGIKIPVQDAHVADLLLVTVNTVPAVTQFLVAADAPGVSIEQLDGLDVSRRFCRVRFDGVEVPRAAVVGAYGLAAGALDQQLALAVALQNAETVGATDRIFEMTLEYVKDRKAFGRPIGSYQALKHRLTDMFLWLESAKAATVAAVRAVQFGVDAPDAASLAKSYVAEHCPMIVRDCLQMHGGIGFTWEHDLHLYLRRIESNAAIHGGCDAHRDRLAAAVGF
jgi:alkylation response protein AidB-like acyl-CoA dehydrogenase